MALCQQCAQQPVRVGLGETKDEVLQRELQQMESSLASTRKIENSKSRLERLGFFKKVDVETVPVTGATDKIDLKYTVEEQPSGAVTASVGYGQGLEEVVV